MFTGIVESVQPVVVLNTKEDILRVQMKKPRNWKLKLGQSVAVDGVCSTVVKVGKTFFEVEYMPETLRKTTMGFLKQGTFLNLERSVTLSTALDGHLVQGHVDAVGAILSVEALAGKYEIRVATPPALKCYIAPRGAITINGVSLTVARTTKTDFMVALIPHTLSHTNLCQLQKGSKANLESDLLARYVVNALENRK